jgi:hypothetical protein
MYLTNQNRRFSKMKSNRKIWLNCAAASALGLLLTATAVSVSAQRAGRRTKPNNINSYKNYGGSDQLRQTALAAGYAEGIKEGRTDRSRNDRFNFSDESSYQAATKGYSSRLGDRALYKKYFRDAFEKGYRDGWNGL